MTQAMTCLPTSIITTDMDMSTVYYTIIVLVMYNANEGSFVTHNILTCMCGHLIYKVHKKRSSQNLKALSPNEPPRDSCKMVTLG